MLADDDPSKPRRRRSRVAARLKDSVSAPVYEVWDVCEEMLRSQAAGAVVDQEVGDKPIEDDICPDYLPEEWL